MTILVAYASSYGSTQEMARGLASDLKITGYAVDLSPVEEVTTLQPYQAVILGTPIHCGLWAKPMQQFLYRTRHDIATKPLYAWITCMRVLEDAGYEHAQRYYVTPELRSLPSVRSIEVFAGRVVPSELTWQDASMVQKRYDGEQTITVLRGDYREWTRFHEWAQTIVTDLKSINITPCAQDA